MVAVHFPQMRANFGNDRYSQQMGCCVIIVCEYYSGNSNH